MPTSLKVLGQSKPTAGIPTDLYTVPADTTTVVSSMTVCNSGTQQDSFSVQIRVAGAVTTAKQFIYSNVPLIGNDTFAATLGISLNEGDIVTVTSTLGISSFNLFGQENT